ncbi:MAG: glucose-6-phosphate isomerase, partial [Phycisphaerae bacterium]|nr:glucose-6-phosphate isomerase [Phycisphaerae bacterium]
MSSLTATPQWKALVDHARVIRGLHLRDLFRQDPGRFAKFSVRFHDLLLDYSKNRITEETMRLLFDLARATGVQKLRDAMFAGEKINITEDRAVLHIALRNRSNRPIFVDGRDVMPEVNAVLQHMREFTEALRQGRWRGFSGKPITDVVNIG